MTAMDTSLHHREVQPGKSLPRLRTDRGGDMITHLMCRYCVALIFFDQSS